MSLVIISHNHYVLLLPILVDSVLCDLNGTHDEYVDPAVQSLVRREGKNEGTLRKIV